MSKRNSKSMNENLEDSIDDRYLDMLNAQAKHKIENTFTKKQKERKFKKNQ